MREAKLDDFDDNEDEYLRNIKINDEVLQISTGIDNDINISEMELNVLVEGIGIELKNN